MALNDTYHSLLIDYASGALDEAHSLIIAAHMALSPNARRIVHEYESIGGGMLQECCTPVAMAEQALQSVLQKLDCISEECQEARKACGCPEAEILPDCLRDYIEAEAQSLPWHKAKPGLQSIPVNTKCQESAAELLRLKGGASLSRTYEITLVLDGAFHDGGQIYSRGDIIIYEDKQTPKPLADRKEGCVCLIVTPAQYGEAPDNDGVMGKLLNFLGR